MGYDPYSFFKIIDYYNYLLTDLRTFGIHLKSPEVVLVENKNNYTSHDRTENNGTLQFKKKVQLYVLYFLYFLTILLHNDKQLLHTWL